MRNRLVILAAALALATVAGAQTPAPQTSPAAAGTSTAPIQGTIDFGAVVGDNNGDTARWERYRDARNGVYTNINFAKDTNQFSFDAKASHIGYRDQKYTVGYDRSRFNFGFVFDSIPLNYFYGAYSPWTHDGSPTLSLDPAIRNAVQGPTNATNDGTAVGVPCAPGAPPAACSNPTQAQQALAARSAYNTVPDLTFDMQAKRQTFGLAGTVFAARDVDINLGFTSTKKSGEMPWGASFAFNNANELPQPIDNRTNDVTAGIEYVKPKGMVRFAWDGSWFSNQNKVLIWDNPIRATDFNNGVLVYNCPTTGASGPWDCSGYSNGNGPAQGRESLWPDNSFQMFSGTALYKLARGTSVNGTLQYRTQDQNESLIPWTINTVIANPNTYVHFPGLASLPRSTAEAGANGVNALVNFNSRPWQRLGIQAKYRYNKRDVTTPHFDAVEYVRFDAVPEETGGETEQFDVTRQNFDANATFSLLAYGAVKVGYAHEQYDREGRGFGKTHEHTLRLSYDAMGLPFLSIRAGFDYGARRGEGFVIEGADYETGAAGEQPGLRYFDEADRNRSKGSLVISANPTDLVSVYVQFAAGKDTFKGDPSIPANREFFGLLDQSFYSWNFGASLNPSDHVSFGANYGYDKFSSGQRSRNANPPCSQNVPPCAPGTYDSWSDPNRDWTLDNKDGVNNFNVSLDLFQAFKNTDIRFAYDFSDSNNSFVHGGPRIVELNTNTVLTPGDTAPCTAGVTDCFIPLPDVTNSWHRVTADVKYYFTHQAGVGLGLYYEKFNVTDFATIDSNGSVGFTTPTGTPRLDYLGEIMTGYQNRPYDGFNFYLRLLYRF